MKKSALVKIIKEAVASKKILKEEKSVDQLMSALGNAILADDNTAMKAAFKDLKTGLIGRIKNKAADLKTHLEKESVNEAGNTLERQVYDAVEGLVERALGVIAKYKETSQTDQSGDAGRFHDVEVALEDVLDFLIYTQDQGVNESAKKIKK